MVALGIGLGLAFGGRSGGGAPYSWDPVRDMQPSLWLEADDPAFLETTGEDVDAIKNRGSFVGSDATASGAARAKTGTSTMNGVNVLAATTATIHTIAGEYLGVAETPNALFEVLESSNSTDQIPTGGTTVGVRHGMRLNVSGTSGRITAVSNSSSVLQDTSGQTLTGPLALIMRASDVQGVQVHINGKRLATTAAARANVTLTAARWGGVATGSTNRFVGKRAITGTVQRAPSVDEMAKFFGYSHHKYGTPIEAGLFDEWLTDDPRTVQHGRNGHFIGDSLMYGEDGSDPGPNGTTAPPMRFAAKSGRRASMVAIPGASSSIIRNNALLVADDFPDRITFVCIGRNNWNELSQVMSDIAAIVATVEGGRFIVMTVLNDNTVDGRLGNAQHTAIIALNDAIKATYPDNYLDWREKITALGAPDGPYPDPVRFAFDQRPAALDTDDAIHMPDVLQDIAGGWMWEAVQERAW